MAVEEPKYALVSAEGDVEIRDYPGLIVAEVDVEGDRGAATNEGFRRLAGYIFGGNSGSSKIAMTAPVGLAPAQGSTIAMTAPVGVSGASGRWTVQFTMPSEFQLGDLPRPNDPRVRLTEVPPTRMAVLKFSGLTGDERVARKMETLLAFTRTHGLAAAGSPSLARYDPPWTPWFMRRNEVMLPLAKNAAG